MFKLRFDLLQCPAVAPAGSPVQIARHHVHSPWTIAPGYCASVLARHKLDVQGPFARVFRPCRCFDPASQWQKRTCGVESQHVDKHPRATSTSHLPLPLFGLDSAGTKKLPLRSVIGACLVARCPSHHLANHRRPGWIVHDPRTMLIDRRMPCSTLPIPPPGRPSTARLDSTRSKRSAQASACRLRASFRSVMSRPTTWPTIGDQAG